MQGELSRGPGELPVGATRALHGAAYAETGLASMFEKLGRRLDVSGGEGAVPARGTSLALRKVDARTVSVLVGPTGMLSVLEDFASGVGGAAATSEPTGEVLRWTGWQVDFNIARAEGLAAYHRLLSTGELADEARATGCLSTATVRVAVGEAGHAGARREASVFTTDEQTGREGFRSTLLLGSVILRSHGEVGDASSHVYEATLPGLALCLGRALGRLHARSAAHGDTVVLVFTADEAERLRQGARDWRLAAEEGHPTGEDGTPDWVRSMADAESAEESLTLLFTSATEAARVAERVLELEAFLLELESMPMRALRQG